MIRADKANFDGACLQHSMLIRFRSCA
ncbi:unnamed protein product [Spirodela intermedia]|uniref:Uncharacterized protein n=1 Tax=Spirodela intermedia TaxID=51605 RepID=A0A7I8JVC7_SPIIN|nr:unnamed protein product [Spirodela intermedia]CAA6673593.1 unnamed protein product [Spirodela intermedia]